MIPRATAYETDVVILRMRVTSAQAENEKLRDILTAPIERGRCGGLECVWWGGGAYLAGFYDALSADIMAGTLRERLEFLMGHNV